MFFKELKIWLTAISIPAFCWYVQITQNDIHQYHENSVAFLQTNFRSCEAQTRGKALGLFSVTESQQGIAHLTAYYFFHPDEH